MGVITRALTMLQIFATLQLAGRRARAQQEAENAFKLEISRKSRFSS